MFDDTNAGATMKCPSCNARLSSKDVVGRSSMMRAEYRCHTCSKVLTPVVGTAYFVFFILIGAPVIEAILHWMLESLFYPVFGGKRAC
jgi:phage FluMu protein Com